MSLRQLSFIFLLWQSTCHARAPLVGRAVTTDVLSKLYEAHQWAAAAYCPNNNRGPAPSKITCPTNNCDLVQADETSATYKFHDVGVAGSTGYVATDFSRSKIVIAFRGSESITNDLADANFPLVSAETICKNCLTEAGFTSFWEAVRSPILAEVQALKASYPSFSIDAIGHSLGAAVATMAVAEVRNLGFAADLYSFCSPRTGDPNFADYVSAQNGVSGTNYRVTHLNDWVPKVPLPLSYQHIANEYHITSPNGVNVTESDITVFQGFESINYTGGNAATPTTDFTFQTHEWIFDRIVQCDPDAIL